MLAQRSPALPCGLYRSSCDNDLSARGVCVCGAVIAFLNSRGAPVRWGKVTEPPPDSEWAKKGAHHLL